MAESCGVCGGDGRIVNSFGGSSKSCPACRGSGRKSEDLGLFRDVTKTKPSHFQKSNVAAAKPTGPAAPTTFEGTQLAKEVEACPSLSKETKAKLVREIMEYETTHATCTQTFSKKIRRQLRPG